MVELNDDIGEEKRIELWKMLLKLRLVEKKAYDLFLENLIKGTSHLSLGQEAIGSAFGVALQKKDFTFCTYRGHAHTLSRGASIKGVLGELMGRESGLMRGKGGSMHLTDVKNGVMGSYAIVGAHLTIANGTAWASQYNKTGAVTTCFFGDGTTNIGAFHEALNLAQIWKLPVVFICENNFYSVYTHLKLRQPIGRKIYKIASTMGAKSYKFSQNNPFKLYLTLKKIFDKVRKDCSTHFVEIETCRYLEHCGPNNDIKLGYRDFNELNKWKKRDPLLFSKNYIIKKKLLKKNKIEKLDKKINDQINKDFLYVSNLRKPKFKNIKNLVYKNK
jgi:pyruvate dehydrogenase E1 component alpha subunit